MREIYQIISNLKVVAKIPEGGRLSIVYSDVNIYEDGWFSWLWRKYNGDSKDRCCAFLHKFYRDLMGFSDSFVREIEAETSQQLKSRKVNLLDSMRENLKASVVGVDNLIHTYRDYPKTVSSLELVKHDLILPLVASLDGYLSGTAALLISKKKDESGLKRRNSF